MSSTAQAPELVLDARASTGESPTWSEPEQVLYWIDVEGPFLHRFDPRTGQDRSWAMPSQIGAFALCRSGCVLVALRTGLARVDLTTGSFDLLAAPPYNPQTHRFNDGKCDARGRFWIGTAFKPLKGAERPKGDMGPDGRAAPIHMFDPVGGLQPRGAECVLANGLAWSLDDRTMHVTDTEARTSFLYDFDPDRGTLSRPRVLTRFQENQGKPDGAAVDAEGRYWCALFGAGRVVRLQPDGSIEREIVLPVSQPTMCAFGGPDLDDLYITTASAGLDEEARRREPHAGGLFRCRPGVRGKPVPLFADRPGH